MSESENGRQQRGISVVLDGPMIEAAMKRRSLSFGALGDILGLSGSTISGVVSGKATKVPTAKAIANDLGLSLASVVLEQVGQPRWLKDAPIAPQAPRALTPPSPAGSFLGDRPPESQSSASDDAELYAIRTCCAVLAKLSEPSRKRVLTLVGFAVTNAPR